MVVHFLPRINFEKTTFILIITFISLCLSCTKPTEVPPHEIHETEPQNVSSGACIDVYGTVFGDIIPYSNVSLYEVSSLNYSIVMNEIRSTLPIKDTFVNDSEGFLFTCLSPGKYTLVIPSSSYSYGVGSPLPYEFDCQNFSLRIAFQGGDYNYLVGTFSIENPPAENLSFCIKNPFSCRVDRDRLYKKCPLDQG